MITARTTAQIPLAVALIEAHLGNHNKSQNAPQIEIGPQATGISITSQSPNCSSDCSPRIGIGIGIGTGKGVEGGQSLTTRIPKCGADLREGARQAAPTESEKDIGRESSAEERTISDVEHVNAVNHLWTRIPGGGSGGGGVLLELRIPRASMLLLRVTSQHEAKCRRQNSSAEDC